MPVNPEAAALRGKRAAAKAATPDQALTGTPVTVGETLTRRYPLLGDPREPKVFAGAAGVVFGPRSGQPRTGYVVAEHDAYEQITPSGCTTSVSRMRWAKGQHVPAAVYEQYLAEQAAQALPVEPEQAAGPDGNGAAN